MRRPVVRPLQLLLPVAMVAVITTFVLLIDGDAAAAALLLVTAVLGASFQGRLSGLLASVLATASLSYFFIPPERVFSIGKRDDAIALGTFVGVALVVSTLFAEAQRAQREAEESALHAAEARVVADVNRSRAAFFAAAGHNLRTPLTTMKAAAASLLEHGDQMSAADRRELLAALAEETERLERLTAKILEVARIRAGGLQPEREHLDLAGLGQAAIRRVAPAHPGLAWHLGIAGGAPPLDLTMTEQILLNLLENAARYAPPGTEVALTGARVVDGTGADGYELAVADHGPGVPEEERDAVFTEFRSDRSEGGSGLGLAIVRALADAQGGTVRCEETPGGGATFVVRFPQRTDPEPRAAT
ncbi:MAG: PAS domain-containing sensor histidine kinase [Acidimicrobiales bacterium]|nr:PAS domain-containing sensor histidine kinase [Acidimicrobiales bacterium]